MKKSLLALAHCFLVFLIFSVWGCVPATTSPTPEESAEKFLATHTEGAGTAEKSRSGEAGQLPVRYQRPSYLLQKSDSAAAGRGDGAGRINLPVGADVSTPEGPKSLVTIINKIAALKNFVTSYAPDVDQNARVSVNIRADQDFFDALDNVLRPLDYSYELQGNTIAIHYKATKKYHIAMPFVSSTYTTNVGGDVLGGTEGNNMAGNLSIASSANEFDIWTNIRTNLDAILEIGTTQTERTSGTGSAESGNGGEAAQGGTAEAGAAAEGGGQATAEAAEVSEVTTQVLAGRGHYTIDRPIGLITVTAPRTYLEKIDNYIESLKKELYKQITIEAKIIEVTLNEDNTMGINWKNLLSPEGTGFDMHLDFSKIHENFSNFTANQHVLTIDAKSFGIVVDAMQDQGHIEVLSNPRISVLNGQPAMISVGETVRFIDSVESSTEDGIITTTVTTASVMSGLGLGVIANVAENDEIILSLTPVTTSLEQPIEYESFGSGDSKVGLPNIDIREMNTMVRVKSGEMIIVGGLISESKAYTEDKIAGLGDIPIAGRLFGTEGEVTIKKELIILMRPVVTTL